MHLEMGIFAKPLDFDQPGTDAKPLEFLPLLGATILTRLPAGKDTRLDLVPRDTGP